MNRSVIKFNEQKVYYVDSSTQVKIYCSPITLSVEDGTKFDLPEIKVRLTNALKAKGFVFRTVMWDSMVVTYHRLEDDAAVNNLNTNMP